MYSSVNVRNRQQLHFILFNTKRRQQPQRELVQQLIQIVIQRLHGGREAGAVLQPRRLLVSQRPQHHEVNQEEGRQVHTLQPRVLHPVRILHAVARHDGEGIALVHLTLDQRLRHVLPQVVLEVHPLRTHKRLVHEQLHHHARALEVVLDRVGLRAADGLLAVGLRPLDDGLCRPLPVVDAFLYISHLHFDATLVEVAEHH